MNTANIITVAIPTFAVLLGILFNRQETMSLRAEISQLRADMLQLRRDMASEIGLLRSEMFQLRNSIHADMVGLHERLAVVEAKQTN